MFNFFSECKIERLGNMGIIGAMESLSDTLLIKTQCSTN